MTTAIRLRLCDHLRNRLTRAYVEYNGGRICLDCVARLYRDDPLKHPSFRAIYYQVIEAHGYILS